MKQSTLTTVKQTKRALRIWIEGRKLIDCGFLPLTRYNLAYNIAVKELVLQVANTGSRQVTGSNRDGKPRPIIDLHSKELEQLFQAGDRVEVVFEHGVITIRLAREQSNQEEREASFLDNKQNGTLREASLFTGGGTYI